ncbi:MAG: ATP-grasp domain-containing protein [Chitinophagales bacterium]|nr:ATP-grasp domain-containing protein [Chitinophagales bacterium]MDW8393233.1 ATP-grasp domain-containing protein [Chitinophagales bacterium]
MAESRRVLVFPCGTEIGLELHRSLAYSRHFSIWGASSVDDHGRMVYRNYIGGLPFVDEPQFLSALKACIQKHRIDYVFPAHDSVIVRLAGRDAELGAEVVTSAAETCRICRSKRLTYAFFRNLLPVPEVYESPAEAPYPLFLKPEIGQGSRGALRVDSRLQAEAALERDPGLMVMEFVPGEEYTIDCFTDRHRQLLFAGARRRQRISSGISVRSAVVADASLHQMAAVINEKLSLRGAWFFQVRRRQNGEPVLLEIAPRIAGTMGLYRALGVNFALLSLFDRMNLDVRLQPLNISAGVERALVSRFDLQLNYQVVYVDLDDCLLDSEGVNVELIRFLYQARNNGKRLVLLTRHRRDVLQSLQAAAISERLFDQIVVVPEQHHKSDYIKEREAIFIDDSFSERQRVQAACGIATFSPDAVEALLDWRR